MKVPLLSKLVCVVFLLAAGSVCGSAAVFQSCDLRISASSGGCDNVFVGWFTTRRDVSSQSLAYGDGFSPPVAPTDRSFNRLGVGCQYTARVTVTQRYANGQTCSASYGNNHNRPCDQCGAVTAPISVVNAANFRSSVTADSIAVAFGDGLTTVTQSASSLPLPKSLGGVQVWVDGEQCDLFAVAPNVGQQPSQVNFRIPASAVAGLRPVRATNREGKSFFGDIFIAGQAPGVFTRDATGGGAAAAAYLVFGVQIYAVLFATGINPDLIGATDVWLQTPSGKYPAAWVGRAPGLVGLVQINVPLPAAAINGQGATLNVAAWQSQGFTLQR